jgi:hypothetical protein
MDYDTWYSESPGSTCLRDWGMYAFTKCTPTTF